MNFSDEEYVRLYVTDTVTWDMLPWQAHCVLALGLRKFDRSGVFDFGKHGAERALVSKTRLPAEVVSVGLQALLTEDVWVLEKTRIFWPKYIEAQTCKRSDRIRQREARARRSSESEQQVEPQHAPPPPPRDTCHVSPSVRDTCHVSSQLSQNVTLGEAREGEAREGILDSGDSDARVPGQLEPPAKQANAAAPPDSRPPIATPPAHPEPPSPPPPPAASQARTTTRADRVRTEWSGMPIQELARRCKENPHDAAMSGPENRPEVLQVQRAWCEAVGLPVRPLGSLGPKNGALQAIIEALSVHSLPEVLRACEQAKRDDWAQGRVRGRDGTDGRKCRLEWMTLNVLRRLLDAADAARPSSVNPRVAAILDEFTPEKTA